MVTWSPPVGDVLVRGYKLGYGIRIPDERWLTIGPNEDMFIIRDLGKTCGFVLSYTECSNMSYAHNG